MRNPLKFLPLHIKWLFSSSFFPDFFCLGFLQFEYYVARCTFFGMYLWVLWVLGVCGRCVSLTLKNSWPLLLQMFFYSLLHPSHRGTSIMPVLLHLLKLYLSSLIVCSVLYILLSLCFSMWDVSANSLTCSRAVSSRWWAQQSRSPFLSVFVISTISFCS